MDERERLTNVRPWKLTTVGFLLFMRKYGFAWRWRICNENQSRTQNAVGNAFKRCYLKSLDEWWKKKKNICVLPWYWSYATKHARCLRFRVVSSGAQRADYVRFVSRAWRFSDTCFPLVFAFGVLVEFDGDIYTHD